jgi:hypothetical protein
MKNIYKLLIRMTNGKSTVREYVSWDTQGAWKFARECVPAFDKAWLISSRPE